MFSLNPNPTPTAPPASADLPLREKSTRSSPRAAPRNWQGHRRRHPWHSLGIVASARGRRFAAHHMAPGDASPATQVVRHGRGHRRRHPRQAREGEVESPEPDGSTPSTRVRDRYCARPPAHPRLVFVCKRVMLFLPVHV